MKKSIVATISIAGILSAGSAAALVNQQVVDNGGSAADSSADISSATSPSAAPQSGVDLAVASTSTTVAPTTVAPTTAAPTTAAPTTAAPTTSVAPAASQSKTFDVGSAGKVTVEVVDGRLVLVSADPKGGWKVTQAEDDANQPYGDNDVDVEFRSATEEIDFEAVLRNGEILTHIESDPIRSSGSTAGTPGAQPPVTTPNSGIDLDDRDDLDDRNDVDDRNDDVDDRNDDLDDRNDDLDDRNDDLDDRNDDLDDRNDVDDRNDDLDDRNDVDDRNDDLDDRNDVDDADDLNDLD